MASSTGACLRVWKSAQAVKSAARDQILDDVLAWERESTPAPAGRAAAGMGVGGG